MQFRHEVKHEVSKLDLLLLRQRLRAVMQADCHAKNGVYQIRSLYFDSPDDCALREKLDGVSVREKFRIRIYDHNPSLIHLERKFKQGGLGSKEVANLTPAQTRAIISGQIDWMAESSQPLVRSFYSKMRQECLTPKVIVDYIREPFVFGPGNVRVTLDTSIRTALRSTAFFDADCPTLPVEGDPCILEVKWDAFLPDVIRMAVGLEDRHATAYSKYAACRMYE